MLAVTPEITLFFVLLFYFNSILTSYEDFRSTIYVWVSFQFSAYINDTIS